MVRIYGPISHVMYETWKFMASEVYSLSRWREYTELTYIVMFLDLDVGYYVLFS